MSANRVVGPGPNWQPPNTLSPRSGAYQAEADFRNSLHGAVARANNLDFGQPGWHFGHAFYPQNREQVEQNSTTLAIIRLEDALLPGTPDLPGIATGYLMKKLSNHRLTATTTSVTVLNYSTSIYAPIGGLALALTLEESVYIAVGSAA